MDAKTLEGKEVIKMKSQEELKIESQIKVEDEIADYEWIITQMKQVSVIFGEKISELKNILKGGVKVENVEERGGQMESEIERGKRKERNMTKIISLSESLKKYIIGKGEIK